MGSVLRCNQGTGDGLTIVVDGPVEDKKPSPAEVAEGGEWKVVVFSVIWRLQVWF
jgi:hypothetical protein